MVTLVEKIDSRASDYAPPGLTPAVLARWQALSTLHPLDLEEYQNSPVVFLGEWRKGFGVSMDLERGVGNYPLSIFVLADSGDLREEVLSFMLLSARWTGRQTEITVADDHRNLADLRNPSLSINFVATDPSVLVANFEEMRQARAKSKSAVDKQPTILAIPDLEKFAKELDEKGRDSLVNLIQLGSRQNIIVLACVDTARSVSNKTLELFRAGNRYLVFGQMSQPENVSPSGIPEQVRELAANEMVSALEDGLDIFYLPGTSPASV